MKVKRVGTIKEHPNGVLDIQYWIIDDCTNDYPEFTVAEEQELIALAKQNGTYSTSD